MWNAVKSKKKFMVSYLYKLISDQNILFSLVFDRSSTFSDNSLKEHLWRFSFQNFVNNFFLYVCNSLTHWIKAKQLLKFKSALKVTYKTLLSTFYHAVPASSDIHSQINPWTSTAIIRFARNGVINICKNETAFINVLISSLMFPLMFAMIL